MSDATKVYNEVLEATLNRVEALESRSATRKSLEGQDNLIGIRVGLKRTSRAKFWLHKQCEIDDLLRALITLRERPVSSHSPEPGRTRVAKLRA